MGKERRRGISHGLLLVSASIIDFQFHNIPHFRKSFLSWFSCQYSLVTKIISSARYRGPPGHLLFFPRYGGVLLLGSLSLCLEKTSLHLPISPATTLPIYLFRIMFSWKRWVVTLLYFLAKREQVHFISVEGTLQSCHLERKNQKMFQKHKGFDSPRYCQFARANSVLCQWAEQGICSPLLSRVTPSYSSQTDGPEGQESPDRIPKNPNTGWEHLEDFKAKGEVSLLLHYCRDRSRQISRRKIRVQLETTPQVGVMANCSPSVKTKWRTQHGLFQGEH